MKKLKRFNKSNKKNIMPLVALCLVVAIVSAAISYAVYQKEDEIPFINASVGEFKENDIELAMKVNGEQVDSPPSKDNYTVTVDCDHADGEWDEEKWGAIITNISSNRVKCEVNFKTPKPTLSEITAKSTKTSIDLSYIAEGIGATTTCKYGTEEGNYLNNVDNVTNENCSITGLEMNVTYYYQVCAKNGAGEICKEGSIKTRSKDLADDVELGDYISMTPTSTSYTLPNELSGCTGTSSTCVQNTINPSELNLWRVISKNEDGTVDVVSEYVSSIDVYFYGKTGYMNLIGGLNEIAEQYTNSKYVQSTRYMGYSNQIEKCSTFSYSTCPPDPPNSGHDIDEKLIRVALGTLVGKDIRGTAMAYWVANRGWSYTNSGVGARDVLTNGTVSYYSCDLMIGSAEYKWGRKIRPILTLKSDAEIVSGDGKSAGTVYQLD